MQTEQQRISIAQTRNFTTGKPCTIKTELELVLKML